MLIADHRCAAVPDAANFGVLLCAQRNQLKAGSQ
jgi:hypothetical protein